MTEANTALATEFHSTMGEWFADELATLIEIDAENATRDDSSCASHDYCDANMAMFEAFTAVYYRDPDMTSQPDLDLMNAAWDETKANGFAAK
jgi:hypothetical protein|tara:strand:- start:372 stop:650 length:279 start_codon:yes stop_codon:yes gene_type:complete